MSLPSPPLPSTAGDDFTPVRLTLVAMPGDSQQCFTFQVKKDNTVEQLESLDIVISIAPDPELSLVKILNDRATYFIIDDDSKQAMLSASYNLCTSPALSLYSSLPPSLSSPSLSSLPSTPSSSPFPLLPLPSPPPSSAALTIGFERSAYSVNEGASVVLAVSIHSNTVLERPVTVAFDTTDGTATAGIGWW